MAVAKAGDTVKVHYTGLLSDGTVFDSSVDREPLVFTLGQDMVIPGFENAIIGMAEGESKSIKIPADEAYGQYREDLVIEVEKNRFPEHITPELGMVLEVHSDDGSTTNVTITQVSETTVTLDGNHPLAGHDLTFEIQLLEIV